MTNSQRIRGVLGGLFMLGISYVMIRWPEIGFALIAAIISITLLFRGIRSMWFYLTMGRFATNGLSSLVAALIQLDLGAFTYSLTDFPKLYLVLYLIVIHFFYGGTEILLGLDAKSSGNPSWKYRIIYGVGNIAIAVAALILGLVFNNINSVVYIFALGFIYSAIVRIGNCLKKTAIVYIQ